jgi:uncharacterized protein YjbI with pentapeptide repeats
MTDPGGPDCSLAGAPPYNAQGCDLTGRRLAGKDLRGANLRGATLLGTSFAGVVSLDGADLTGTAIGAGTDFSGCDLTKVIFGVNPPLGSDAAHPVAFRSATVPYRILGANWQALNLSGATIEGMPAEIDGFTVTECDVSGLDFSAKVLKNAHFLSVTAHQAGFRGATLDNAVFGRRTATPTDLTGAVFAGASIPGGVYDTATLTDADFTKATLANATFLNARMDGTVFDGTDLTSCAFSSPPWWSKQPGGNTSFRGATLNLTTLGRQWSYLDLTGATLAGLAGTSDLDDLEARGAVLTGLDLSGHSLDRADLTGTTIAGTIFRGAHMDYATLRSVAGERPVFDGAVLTGARFDPSDSGSPTTLRGASFAGAHLEQADVSHADFSPASDGTAADFRGAGLGKLTAAGASLASANLSGVVMHGAVFTDATLTGADLTAAVLGALSNVFTVAAGEAAYDPFLVALRAADVGTVTKIFAAHQVTLGPGAQVTVEDAARAWQVQNDPTIFTVLLVTAKDGTTSLQVFQPAEHAEAELTGAFMPDAILTDANLIGVKASAVQLFATKSSLNQLAGAVLNNINLSNAILGSAVAIDLSQARLAGATLSFAFLMNADLGAADLTGAALDHTQLQGAKFADAILTDATLADAAVSVLVLTSDEGTDTYGVPLFVALGAAAAGSPLLAELEAATVLVLADENNTYDRLAAALNSTGLGEVRAAFSALGVTISASATVLDVANPEPQGPTAGGQSGQSIWVVSDPAAAGSYTVWEAIDFAGTQVINARPSTPELTKLFSDNYAVVLFPQATIGSISTADETKAWVIDNDSTNPDNFQTGYVQFVLVQQGADLAGYGTLVHATRAASTGQDEMGIFSFAETNLRKDPQHDPGDTYLLDSTTCPNGYKLGVNQYEGRTWAEMMQAQDRPPAPPPCVPSPVAPCNSNSLRAVPRAVPRAARR